jgi:hypothetical protein
LDTSVQFNGDIGKCQQTAPPVLPLDVATKPGKPLETLILLGGGEGGIRTPDTFWVFTLSRRAR